MKALNAIVCGAALILILVGAAQGNVLVAEYSANQVTEYNHNGVIVWQITGLSGTRDVDMMPNGNVLITEWSGRVAEWTTAGAIVWQITGLNQPYAAERVGNRVLITEYGAGRVALWNTTTATPIWQIVGLSGPIDAKLAGSHKVWIAEFNGAGAGAGTVTEYLDNAPGFNWQLTGFTQPVDIEKLGNKGLLVTERPLGTVIEWQWNAGYPVGVSPVGAVATIGWSIGGLNNPRDAEWGPDGYVLIAEQGTAPLYVDGTVIQVKRSDNSIAWSKTSLSFPCNVESYRPEVWVDDDWVNQAAVDLYNPNLTLNYNAFRKIKYGISAVQNSTVHVLPGTYVENGQIVINKDVTIIGDAVSKPIVMTNQNTGTAGDARGWWLVKPGKTLHMQNLVLDGSGYKVYQAIRHLGQGTIDNVDFVNIKYDESGPYYSGLAVVAFGADGPVDVTNSTFNQIGRVGALYFGAGINGSVFTGNTYVGKGAGDWLDYALDISAGAQITVSNCAISDCLGVASSDGSTSAGIMVTTLYGAGTQAQIAGSTITNCSTGIFVGYNSADTSDVTAHNNIIAGNGTGVDNVSSTKVVDARFNDWGHIKGPYDPLGTVEVPPCQPWLPVNTIRNFDGPGDGVTDNVQYCPWTGMLPVPTAKTLPATDIGDTSAKLNGEVMNDRGTPCLYNFYYWKSGDIWVSSTGWTGSVNTGDLFSEVLTGLTPGTKYWFWADVHNYWGTCGWSSGLLTFTTLNQPIEVKTPNGGECLLGGSNFPIEWSASPGIADVLIEYSLDAGTIWHQIATVPNTDPKQYNWTVPTMPVDTVLNFHFDNEAALGEDYTAGGLVNDYSGFDNHGTLLDPPGVPTWITDGVIGGAFDFTGTGHGSGQAILVVPNADSLNPGPNDFAVAVWVKTRSNVDGDILRKGSSSNSSTWYKIEHGPDAGDKLSVNFNTDGTDATVTSGADYNDDQWHFVVAQRNGAQAELWIDGVLDGTAPISGAISNDANLAIGSMDTLSDDFLNDSLDEVRIFKRSLSQAEIQLMNLLGNSDQSLVCVSDAADPGTNDVSDNQFSITTCVIPNIVGMAQVDAEAAINAAGLTVGAITQAYSNTVPKGSVISQDPAAASPACPGKPVNLVISLGPKPVPATAIPVAKTEPATAIGSDTATLKGKITNDGGGTCQSRFFYWKYGDMWITSTTWTGSIRTGDTFSLVLTGLQPGTTYYYWAEAKNSFGKSAGWSSGLLSFTTQN